MTVTEFQQGYNIKIVHDQPLQKVDFLSAKGLGYTHLLTVRRGRQSFRLHFMTEQATITDEQVLTHLATVAPLVTKITGNQFYFCTDVTDFRANWRQEEGEALFSLYLLVGIDGYKDFLRLGNGHKGEDDELS